MQDRTEDQQVSLVVADVILEVLMAITAVRNPAKTFFGFELRLRIAEILHLSLALGAH